VIQLQLARRPLAPGSRPVPCWEADAHVALISRGQFRCPKNAPLPGANDCDKDLYVCAGGELQVWRPPA